MFVLNSWANFKSNIALKSASAHPALNYIPTGTRDPLSILLESSLHFKHHQHTCSCSLMSVQKADSHISGVLTLPNPWFKVLRHSDKSISHQINLENIAYKISPFGDLHGTLAS